MSYKSKRSKITDISQKVKKIVYERDNGRCVVCGLAGMPNAHVIPRSKRSAKVFQKTLLHYALIATTITIMAI